VTDQDDPLEAKLTHTGGDILTERSYRPYLAAGAGFSVICKIDGHHPERLREGIHLSAPVGSVT
jgi:hypothetical protein